MSYMNGTRSEEANGYLLTSFSIGRVGDLFRKISSLKESHAAILDDTGKAIGIHNMDPELAGVLDELSRHPMRYIINKQPH